MAGFRDSRFGQFADPNFGASLSTPQQSQGVLPSPEASTSASSDQSNGASTVGLPGLMGGHNTEGNPGSVYLAEGGEVPGDTGQDSGDAAPANTDPFSMITSALATGRKKFGLPSSFYGGGSDTGNSDGPQPQNFAEGGEVQGDGDDDADDQQGVLPTEDDQSQDQGQQPQQGQQQGGGQSSQSAMAYLKGAGAVPPEVANALERQVDPHGQMDPSLRKTLAVTQAGDPNKAFGLMQHYRQKFNALGAFAKAALMGSGGRPPNPHAAADALNKAYAHVPDGTALEFSPVQGGMQVAVRNVMPGKGQQPQQPQQQEPEPQSFADGGPVNNSGGSVDDEDFNMETAGSQTPSGSPYDRAAQASAAQQEPSDVAGSARGVMDAMTPKRDPNNGLQNFILSIPQLIGWQSKAGQFDSVMDKGVEATLAEAGQDQQQPQGQPQGQPQPQGQGDQGVTSQRPMDRGNTNPIGAGSVRETPRNPEAFGAKVGTQGGEEGATLHDVLHEIDQAYPTVGMAKQRALARAAARQHWADNRTKIEAEQTKGSNALERAKVAGGSRERVADKNVQGRIETVGMQQTGAGERNQTTNQARRDVAHEREGGVQGRFQQGEAGRNDRAVIAAKPNVIGNQQKMDEARKVMNPGQQQPQQRPATQQQPSQGTGPAPTSVPPPGMKYQQNAAGTKWRLVPAQ